MINSQAKEAEKPVCGIIQISGNLHVQHLPCYDHQDDQIEKEEEWIDYEFGLKGKHNRQPM